MIRYLLLLCTLAWPVTRTHQELIDLVGRKGDVTHLYDLYNRAHWVTPQEHGAAADSINDDLQEIQAAIDAISVSGGGTVFFPKGEYRISATINAKSNVDMVGERGAVILCAGTALGSTVNYPYIDINARSNIRITGLKINGHGTWTATPFASPYGAGNSVGFKNRDAGIQIQGASSNILIDRCEFTGLGYGLYVAGNGTSKKTGFSRNYCHNLGTGCAYLQVLDDFQANENLIDSVLGNTTAPGVTTTDSSFFADGLYIYNSRFGEVSDNVISEIIRIGIVLEGDAVTRCKAIAISNNTISRIRDAKGGQFNAGIWAEGSKSEEPVALTGNVIFDSDNYGIQASKCAISGGSIRACAGGGVVGENFSAVGVSLEENRYGFDASNGTDAEDHISIQACKVRRNTHGGISLEQSRGYHTISGNYIEDNSTDTVGHKFGIRIARYYNAQKVVISGNTFVSSADSSDTVGQIYSIRGVAGGDFNYDTKFILSNVFVFTGAIRTYPNSLAVVPCSFGYDNTTTVFPYEIAGWGGNVNSKMEQPDISQTYAAGYPRFLGFTAAAPGSGSFRQGDFYLFTNIAAGGYIGTINTTTGSPGTWKSFGAILP